MYKGLKQNSKNVSRVGPPARTRRTHAAPPRRTPAHHCCPPPHHPHHATHTTPPHAHHTTPFPRPPRTTLHTTLPRLPPHHHHTASPHPHTVHTPLPTSHTTHTHTPPHTTRRICLRIRLRHQPRQSSGGAKRASRAGIMFDSSYGARKHRYAGIVGACFASAYQHLAQASSSQAASANAYRITRRNNHRLSHRRRGGIEGSGAHQRRIEMVGAAWRHLRRGAAASSTIPGRADEAHMANIMKLIIK